MSTIHDVQVKHIELTVIEDAWLSHARLHNVSTVLSLRGIAAVAKTAGDKKAMATDYICSCVRV